MVYDLIMINGLEVSKEAASLRSLIELPEEVRTGGHNAVMVADGMGGVVVLLDVLHFESLFDAVDLPHILAPPEDMLVVDNLLLVALEVHDVDFIEASDSHPETNVGEREGLTGGEFAAVGEESFKLVQRRVEVGEGDVVGFLRIGKAGFVDAVVDALVGPVIDLLLSGLERDRVQVKVWVFGESIERGVEDLDNFRALIVHNCLMLRVPQDGHRFCRLRLISYLVEITDKLGTVEGVLLGIVVSEVSKSHRVFEADSRSGKGPSAVLIGGVLGSGALPDGVDDGHSDDILESFHVADCGAPVGPRAGPTDVEVVAASFWLELFVVCRGDVSEGSIFSDVGARHFRLLSGRFCLNHCGDKIIILVKFSTEITSHLIIRGF